MLRRKSHIHIIHKKLETFSKSQSAYPDHFIKPRRNGNTWQLTIYIFLIPTYIIHSGISHSHYFAQNSRALPAGKCFRRPMKPFESHQSADASIQLAISNFLIRNSAGVPISSLCILCVAKRTSVIFCFSVLRIDSRSTVGKGQRYAASHGFYRTRYSVAATPGKCESLVLVFVRFARAHVAVR